MQQILDAGYRIHTISRKQILTSSASTNNCTIQREEFKNLMKELAPPYKILSKDTLNERLDEIYDAVTHVFERKLSEISYVINTTNTDRARVL